MASVIMGRSRMSLMPRGSVGPPSKSLPSITWSSPTSWMARSTTPTHSSGVIFILGGGDPDHRKRWGSEAVEFLDGHEGFFAADVGGVPERLAGVPGTPDEDLHVVELVADLKSDHPAPGGQLLEQVVGHVARDIIQTPQTVMCGNDGVGALIDGL